MATIREYFDADAKVFTISAPWSLLNKDKIKSNEIVAKVAYDFEANAKYWYFYIPLIDNLSECLGALFSSENMAKCRLDQGGDGIHVSTGQAGYSEELTNHTLQFTKRVHLYLDFELSPANRTALVSEAFERGYYLSIRDRDYARARSEAEKPQAFISHDSRDKELFVRELVQELSKFFCTVWYDEYTLKIGDSLRSSIESGLKETRKCIVVLSPNYLSNNGWGRAEFDSVFTREILEKQNVILPVWLNVGVKDIYDYCPRLADKVGVSASLGIQEVARQLASVIKMDT